MGSSKIVASQGLAGSQNLSSENLSASEKDNSPTVKSTNGRSFTDSKPPCSSLSAHIITALVLAILVGTAAATATYFLFQQSILYTALAGLCGFVITSLVTYLIMRACLNVPEPSLSIATDELSHY